MYHLFLCIIVSERKIWITIILASIRFGYKSHWLNISSVHLSLTVLCVWGDGRARYTRQHHFSTAIFTPPEPMFCHAALWKHKTKQMQSVFRVRSDTPELLYKLTVQNDVWKRTWKPSQRETARRTRSRWHALCLGSYLPITGDLLPFMVFVLSHGFLGMSVMGIGKCKIMK